jgi:hypothetical protein
MHPAKSNEPASPKQQQTATVYREIPASNVPETPAPGQVGQAAVTAAAMHQLNRYADDIEQYVNASNMRVLLNKIQGELKKDQPGTGPKMRLRRE